MKRKLCYPFTHDYGKWEYVTEKWIRPAYGFEAKNHYKKEFKIRFCSKCGKRQRVFVDSWPYNKTTDYGEI